MVAFAAVPATARDHAAYVGLEAGPMWPQDSQIRIVTHFNGMTFISSPNTSYKAGIDGDLVGGYDFGIVRAEVEGAQKWADHDESCDRGNCVDALGLTRARSLMGN